jgi:hypothetical protein
LSDGVRKDCDLVVSEVEGLQISELGDGVWHRCKTQSVKIQLTGIGSLRLIDPTECFLLPFSSLFRHSFDTSIIRGR